MTNTTDDANRTTDTQAEAVRAAAQAAARTENGEFIFQTRAEVTAFVNALPAGVKVRWQAESLLTTVRYRVTFWRSFWLFGSSGGSGGGGAQQPHE